MRIKRRKEIGEEKRYTNKLYKTKTHSKRKAKDKRTVQREMAETDGSKKHTQQTDRHKQSVHIT